jgi:hypothetical protein
MLKNAYDIRDKRELLLVLLSNSGTLAGISLALVGILNLKPITSVIGKFADDFFLFSSLGFVIVCYLVFFAMRHLESPRIMSWCNIIDFLFLASLTLQVVAGFITVYTFI